MVTSLAAHFAGMRKKALHVDPYSLVQICLQAGVHALNVVVSQRFLHLHNSITSPKEQEKTKLATIMPGGINPTRDISFKQVYCVTREASLTRARAHTHTHTCNHYNLRSNF